jgi:UDP-glucose 4-epimerase
MKILVTGGAGFIGSHVVTAYLDLGHEVIVVDDLSTGHLSNLDPRAKFYQMDIRDPRIRKIFSQEMPEVVNHHAAQMNVRRSVSDPLFDAQVNVVGSLQLIECAKEYSVKRFIYISTGGAVYGEPEYLPCDEKHPINPICQYGASKHTVEHYLYMYYKNYGLQSIVLRYPNVYGPKQDPNGEAGVVAIFTGLMMEGKSVIINGDGEQTRDYVYVSDCARANVLALESTIEHDIINIGSGLGTSVNEIYERLCELTDYQGSAHNGPAGIGETRHICLDAQRAHVRLNWYPEVDLKSGLAKTVSYFREHEQLVPMAVKQVVKAKEGGPVEKDVKKIAGKAGQSCTIDIPMHKEHMFLYEEPESRQRIHKIERALSGKCLQTTPLADILKAVIDGIGGESGSILIFDDGGRITNAVIGFNNTLVRSDSERLGVTLEKGLAGWVRRRSHAALVQDTSSDPRWYQTSWEQTAKTARSAMSVPLVEEQKVRGVLTITCPHAGKFTNGDLALLLTASTLLAINQESPP